MSDDPDIYAIRRARCTQKQFADALSIPANTVRSWEQRRKSAGADLTRDLYAVLRTVSVPEWRERVCWCCPDSGL
jgi:DNA-binding transcriptional regulator YiaG